jgi:hypothetical protein
MAATKKKTVIATNQSILITISNTGLKPKIGSTLSGAIAPLVILTTSVSGRIAVAMTCVLEGKEVEVNGKKVPARKRCVTKRNVG